MIGRDKMIKKGFLLLLCLLVLSSCAAPHAITDGTVYELYMDSSALNSTSSYYTLYHMQNRQLSKTGRYKPCFSGGTPVYIRDKVGAYYGTDGQGMYSQGYGQLDDYYISENIEAYLYVLGGVSNLMYFENGVQQDINIPGDIEFRQTQYRDDFLYLIGFFGGNSTDTCTCDVLKIDTTTKQTELLQYKRPYYQNIIPYSGDEYTIMIEGDILISKYWIHSADDPSALNETVCISYPGGKYIEIPTLDKYRNSFVSIFETGQGFGVLESIANIEDLSQEDFFLQLRYFDTKGNQTDSKEIDCSTVLSTARETVFIVGGAQYYDDMLYLAISTHNCKTSYIFEYDIKEQSMTYCDKVSGIPEEAQMVKCKNGVVYSIS